MLHDQMFSEGKELEPHKVQEGRGQDKQTQSSERLLGAGAWKGVRGREKQRTLVTFKEGSESLATEQEHLYYLRPFKCKCILFWIFAP